jgi:membrane-associated phospholipid phosphatase
VAKAIGATLALLGASAAAPAASAEPLAATPGPAAGVDDVAPPSKHRLRWPYERFSAPHAAASGVATAAGLSLELFVRRVPDGTWTDGALFDGEVRRALAGGTAGARARADVASDYLWQTLQSYPVLVDGLLVPLALDRGNTEVALQLSLINWQALSFTHFLTRLSHRTAGRGRPALQGCRDDPHYNDEVCEGGPPVAKVSFISGHTSMSFAGAGLACAHHASLPLYGGGAADAVACGVAMTAATTTGVLRVVADKHWASDVLAGAGLGLATGLGLPLLFHYRQRVAGAAPAPAAAAAVAPFASADSLGLGAMGYFLSRAYRPTNRPPAPAGAPRAAAPPRRAAAAARSRAHPGRGELALGRVVRPDRLGHQARRVVAVGRPQQDVPHLVCHARDLVVGVAAGLERDGAAVDHDRVGGLGREGVGLDELGHRRTLRDEDLVGPFDVRRPHDALGHDHEAPALEALPQPQANFGVEPPRVRDAHPFARVGRQRVVAAAVAELADRGGAAGQRPTRECERAPARPRSRRAAKGCNHGRNGVWKQRGGGARARSRAGPGGTEGGRARPDASSNGGAPGPREALNSNRPAPPTRRPPRRAARARRQTSRGRGRSAPASRRAPGPRACRPRARRGRRGRGRPGPRPGPGPKG